MASPQLEELILNTIRVYNERNEPIGKKAIYQRRFAAISTVQKAINQLEADGKIVIHKATLRRGTYSLLMIRPEGQPRDETINQHIATLTLYQTQRNGELLTKILKKMEEKHA